jgi:hypothetical protein
MFIGCRFVFILVEFLFDAIVPLSPLFGLNTFIVTRPEGDLLLPTPTRFFYEVRSIIDGLNEPTVGVLWGSG